MEEVTQECVSLEGLLRRQRSKPLVIVIPQEPRFPAFAIGPRKDLAFYGTGNGEGQVRPTCLEFVGAQIFEQKAERLLGDVFLREARLLPLDATNRAVQHRQECEDQNAFNESRSGCPRGEEVAEQVIGSR